MLSVEFSNIFHLRLLIVSVVFDFLQPDPKPVPGPPGPEGPEGPRGPSGDDGRDGRDVSFTFHNSKVTQSALLI